MRRRPPCLCTGRTDIRCDAEHCDLAHPAGAPGHPDLCKICWQYHHSQPHNLVWGGDGQVQRWPPKIFHVGLPRTGSQSLTQALKLLGLTVIQWPRLQSEIITSQAVTEMYQADLADLLRRWPDARFIWTTRRAEDWLRSCDKTAPQIHDRWNPADPRDFSFWSLSSDARLALYSQREAEARAAILPARLLVWPLCEQPAWKPLCDFLGLPIPAVPFPRVDAFGGRPAPIAPPGGTKKNQRWREKLPCIRLASATGEERVCPGCRGTTRVKLFHCRVHGSCTPVTALPGVACCQSCTDYREPVEWISTAQLTADAVSLVAQLPPRLAGVVGIPRSGILPASALATHLHLPLLELTEKGVRPLGHGIRGKRGFAAAPDAPYLVVDDSVYNGAAMQSAKQVLRDHAAFFAAVYVTPWMTELVDFFARAISPHLFEWNLVNAGIWAGNTYDPIFGGGFATDLDGILCRDPTVPDADDGPLLERYRQWLSEAAPRLLPRRVTTKLIVTARLERWRPETEAWLRKWGVQWERLIMHPAAKASQRGDIAAWKAQHYGASRCSFFCESSPEQAAEIFRLTGKPVVCPAVSRVWQ